MQFRLLDARPSTRTHYHHHHHFICPIIQQFAHVRKYDSRAGQQGPIKTLTAVIIFFFLIKTFQGVRYGDGACPLPI